MSDGSWAIYGATGYTGRLAARHAVEQGERPLLLGRSAAKLAPLAEELGLEYRAVSLEDRDGLRAALEAVSTVVHAAGPFAHTWRPMAEACLDSGTHYLDITGEVEVFESLRALGAAASERGVTVMPGIAFDVVPSDCLGAHLASRLPTATELTIAIGTDLDLSHGTASTVAEQMTVDALIRRNKRLEEVVPASKELSVDFGADVGVRTVYLMRWGDLSTAHHTTGIGNIETYLPLDRQALTGTRLARRLPWLFRRRVVQRLLVRQLTGGKPGPDETTRAGKSAAIWGQATDGGRTVTARLQTTHPYTLSALAMVETARRVSAGDVAPGFQTPAGAFGADYVLEFEGSSRTDL